MTTRRLVAILAADVAGFSAMMERDEDGTFARITALREEIIEPAITAHHGRLVKTTGDGFLAEFASPVEAVRCAIAILDGNAAGGEGSGESERIALRIGVNLGDVIVGDDGDIYGDGVNVAARLQQIADSHGLCVSAAIHDQIAGKVSRTFADRGEQQIRNIARPVRVYALIGAIDPPPLAQQRPLTMPDRPSIAVLPFTNMSGDPEQDYFADGMVEDIITALSRFKSLFVIARNSSFTYKGKPVDVKQVGRELGVRYVLEGSVRKAGGSVRITAQLIEAASGAHLWAERYEGRLDDVFALQDEVTTSVVRAIAPRMERAEIDRARAKPVGSLDAYDLYLRALPHLHTWTRDGFRSAEDLLRAAVKRDPEFSDAWAMLADCLWRQIVGGWARDADRSEREACDAALRGVDADPENGIALAAAAGVLSIFRGTFDAAIEHALRALALHPNSAYVRTNSCFAFIYSGEPEKALEHLEAARRISPVDPRGYITLNVMAQSHFFSKRFIEAGECARRAIEQSPNHPVSLRLRAASLVQLGRLDEARDTISHLVQGQPGARISLLRYRYRHAWMRELMVDSLRAAGLPD